MKYSRLIIGLLMLLTLTGCVSIDGMNSKFREVDNVWTIENQKLDAKYYHRTVDATYEVTFDAVIKTFNDLGLPVNKSSFEKGYVITRNAAPKPLSKEQWAEVREIENPKVKEISWMVEIQKNPKDQFVTIKASIENHGNQTDVNLDYYLDAPKYEDMGMIPPRQAPPHAVKLVSKMFWDKFEKNILNKEQ